MADSHQSAIAYQKEHLRDSRKAEIIAPTAVFLAIAYVAVFFRYKSRRVAHLKLGPDDLCIGIGLTMTTCFIMIYHLSMKYGMGRHEILIKDPKAWVILLSQHKLSTAPAFVPSCSPSFFSMIASSASLNRCSGTILQCIPLSDLWKPPSDNPPVCIDFGTLVITMGVVNIVTDVTILSLPMPIVWSLQVSTPRRWQLVIAFSLGGM